jgi:sporulation protein YlmC with PRC-barrel domain
VDIEYGTEVIDRDGKALGTVNYVIRNMWTGEISKFMVRREPPERELFFSPQDVLEAAEAKIKVDISSEELSESSQKLP